MKEHPILFSTLMVRALLNTKPNTWPAKPIDPEKPFKSMTRRLIKPQPDKDEPNIVYTTIEGFQTAPPGEEMWVQTEEGESVQLKPKYEKGDLIWVRETWTNFHDAYWYKADIPESVIPLMEAQDEKWHPSIHMPREAARLFLEVKSVRIERLQDISEKDALAEGVGLYWLKNWIKKNYQEPDEHARWVHDCFSGYDQSLSFCRKCGEKEVRKVKREAKQKGATKEEIEDIFLDGGWMQEDDIPTNCENCGKPLLFTALKGCLDYEMEHYIQDGFDKSDTYLLDQVIDEDIGDIESFNKICFRTLWDSLYAKRGYSWENNPWVFVYSFMRVEK